MTEGSGNTHETLISSPNRKRSLPRTPTAEAKTAAAAIMKPEAVAITEEDECMSMRGGRGGG